MEGIIIGVAAVQGDVLEHIDAMVVALEETGVDGEVTEVKELEQFERTDALVIPGGESTTISRFLVQTNIFSRLQERVQTEDYPVMGTCAGCIILASEGDREVTRTDTNLLGLMDMEVKRNAFGRQRESFESDLSIDGFNGDYHAVFIRAPAITRLWGDCRAMASIDRYIVMARQKNLLALTFHPELSSDSRVHRYFIDMIR